MFLKTKKIHTILTKDIPFLFQRDIMMQKNIPLSTGFINIPAFFIFIPITIIMAKIGATVVHKIKRDLIAKLFGFFLIIIASRFLYEYFNF